MYHAVLRQCSGEGTWHTCPTLVWYLFSPNKAPCGLCRGYWDWLKKVICAQEQATIKTTMTAKVQLCKNNIKEFLVCYWFGDTSAVLRACSWWCSVSPMQCQGLNPGELCARQVASPGIISQAQKFYFANREDVYILVAQESEIPFCESCFPLNILNQCTCSRTSSKGALSVGFLESFSILNPRCLKGWKTCLMEDPRLAYVNVNYKHKSLQRLRVGVKGCREWRLIS